MAVSSGKIFRPVTEKMRGGGPGVIVAVSGDLLEEIRVDPASLLMEPKRFSEMVSMVGIGRIE